MKQLVVLFEDTDEYQKKVLPALKAALGGRGEAVLFAPKAPRLQTGVYQDRIEGSLSSPPYGKATLIVADYDLSATPEFPGLSEQQVKAAASRLAIPECGYARGTTSDSSKDFLRLAKQREASIVLDYVPGHEDELASQVAVVAEGFDAIAEQLPNALGKLKRTTPGMLLASILGRSEYADKIALYASGDQDRLESMRKDSGEDEKHYSRRLSCALGYWLWDSVLRYPGALVNFVAASSYLNVSTEDFGDVQVQRLYSAALYSGPFAQASKPQWWRGVLDDIVAESGCADGREYATKSLGRGVRPCVCSVDGTSPAGYYCMVTNLPVSLKNSVGGLSWFPRGADLARVSRTKMEELGPWL